MAIWQFQFYIIHKSKKTLDPLHYDYFDTVISWEGHAVDENSLEKLKLVLPIEKSWSNKIVQYGNNDETNVRLFYENDIIMEMFCRIDLRYIRKNIFDSIVDFINANKALVFYNGIVYDNISKRDLVNLVLESEAYSFCKNPIKFFEKFRSEHPPLD